MFLAAQYYRPPFPDRGRWADDLSRMRDAGLHALQLWCIWGWIESEPGVYRYDDYDELVALAEKRGLKVVLSTIAEIHPFWIHRLVPGSELVDDLGRAVVSDCRGECNVGLTPGGCFDHPRVAELMAAFLTDIASRYAQLAHLIGWDCWNETRWAVGADGHVCYCPNTLRAFRRWLDARHGGLEGLSAAWKRRYASWHDVRPSKAPHLPFTGTMEFLRFLAARAAEHARFRYEAIRRGDPKGFISAHCGQPCTLSSGGAEQTLARGVDWDLADQLDGFGCSHFPLWGGGFAEEMFGLRVETTRSATRGKPFWISELQGGAARSGIVADTPVPAADQQRWIASAMARGAKGVIFWCWRDEVFTHEASGFGLDGWDGLAPQRLAAMRKMRGVIDRSAELIEDYRPDAAKVGVLFVPDAYQLRWSVDARAAEAVDGLAGYATALERLGIAYELVEARHADVLKRLDVLLMPWALVLPAETRRAVLALLRRGGTVLTEAETDAYDELGFFRYPGERPFMRAVGVGDLGRRPLDEDKSLAIDLDGEAAEVVCDNFTTPLKAPRTAAVLAMNERDESLAVRKAVGKGAAWVVGSFLGRAYFQQRSEGLERLIAHVCRQAGARPDLQVEANPPQPQVIWRTGRARGKRLLWLVNPGPERTVTITDRRRMLAGHKSIRDLTRGRTCRVRTAGRRRACTVTLGEGGWALLAW